MALGRFNREAKRSFKASDRFGDGLDKAREDPPRLRGRRLRNAVNTSFIDSEGVDQAAEAAHDRAISSLVAIAKSYKRKGSEPASTGLELTGLLGEEREDDPLDTLLEEYEQRVENYPVFGTELVATLAQVGAAAILQLSKEVDQSPKTVVRALMTKYFNDADGRG